MGDARREVLDRFEACYPEVEIAARKLARGIGGGVGLEELISLGTLGLLQAAHRYEPGRGVPFAAYARHRVQGAILDGIRSECALPRRVHQAEQQVEQAATARAAGQDPLTAPAAGFGQAEEIVARHRAGVSAATRADPGCEPAWGDAGALEATSPDDDPETHATRAQLRQLVRQALEELPEPQAEVIRQHVLDERGLEDVARELGMSPTWARQLEARAMRLLGKRLRGTLATP